MRKNDIKPGALLALYDRIRAHKVPVIATGTTPLACAVTGFSAYKNTRDVSKFLRPRRHISGDGYAVLALQTTAPFAAPAPGSELRKDLEHWAQMEGPCPIPAEVFALARRAGDDLAGGAEPSQALPTPPEGWEWRLAAGRALVGDYADVIRTDVADTQKRQAVAAARIAAQERNRARCDRVAMALSDRIGIADAGKKIRLAGWAETTDPDVRMPLSYLEKLAGLD